MGPSVALLFNAHYDERCFGPLHVYDTATSRPVTVPLRTGTTPSGAEIRSHLRRMVRRIRSQWLNTRQSAADDLSREDWLGLLIDREVTARGNKRLGRRLSH
jgi:hypothetical protein